jgi:hypothetical protein
MKHPTRSDFHTAVTGTNVAVTFAPTNSIYSFERLAGTEDIARLGPVSLGGVQHAGPSGDTGEYAADEVQAMAQLVAADIAKSVWSAEDLKAADKLQLRRHSIGGDDDVIDVDD